MRDGQEREKKTRLDQEERLPGEVSWAVDSRRFLPLPVSATVGNLVREQIWQAPFRVAVDVLQPNR